MSFFCPGVVWGQLLTRLKLNACGMPSKTAYKYTFSIMVGAWITYLIFHQIQTGVNQCIQEKKLEGYDDLSKISVECSAGVGVIAGIISFALLIFMVCGLVRARNHLRTQKQIKGGCLGSEEGCLDDCLTSWFCTCCATIQMVRETQGEHPYVCCDCCNPTGLPSGVEVKLEQPKNVEMERFTEDTNAPDADMV